MLINILALLNDFNGEIKKVTSTPGKGGDHLNFKFLTQVLSIYLFEFGL